MTLTSRNHRYVLRRNWGFRHGSSCARIVNFVMLNPSTADDKFDDPTIRRCVGFGKRWGYDGIVVTNLYAYRATDPKELIALSSNNPLLAIGEENDQTIRLEAMCASLVVAAWGDNCDIVKPRRDLEVIRELRGADIMCIRKTAKGNPAHPVREAYVDVPTLLYSKLNMEVEMSA